MNRFSLKSIIRKTFFPAAVAVVFLLGFRAKTGNEFEITKNFEIFREVYAEIYNNYVDEHEPGDLMKRGIDGMLESLDPYTNFIPESNIEDYRLMTTGQYGGIGALIKRMDDYIFISEPYEGFPAHKAGLVAGDKILEIDGKNMKGKDSAEVSEMLKGAAGTTVKLKVEHDGKSIEKTLKREEVKIPDVPYFGMITDQVGYIKLNQFTQSASKEVHSAFTSLKGKGMKKLVLDLRGNGGGLLNEAVKIVNFFVPKGVEVVKQKGRVPEMNITYVAREEPLDTEIPLVILVDGGTASASEIVSGGLQDLDRAVIAGERSFGKGLVQQTRKMPYNSIVKLTVAKYYTPSGRCIQKLDYTHKRASDHAAQLADSLVKQFKTAHGRLVTDARGIEPDMESSLQPLSNLAITLLRDDMIFQYANAYVRKHDAPASAKGFTLTEDEYKEFMSFVNAKELDYKTATQVKFEEFRKMASREHYESDMATELQSLENKVKPNKSADLMRFKDEITRLLESEIVSRYFFQNGRAESDLKDDPCIHQALEVLGNESLYKSILDGTYKKTTDKK